MIDPTAFQQMERSSSELLIKILIPLWLVLSIWVTIWSYKSTRAKVFWKNLYKNIFTHGRGSNKEKRWFRK